MKSTIRPPIDEPKDVGIWIRVSTEEQARGEAPEHHLGVRLSESSPEFQMAAFRAGQWSNWDRIFGNSLSFLFHGFWMLREPESE